MNDINKGYLGNPNLKGAGIQLNFTSEQVDEWIKCSDDPLYFIENYVKIVTLDEGLKLMELYPFQRDLIMSMADNRKSVGVVGRQSGKCIYQTTKVLLRHNKTGETMTINIGDFHNSMS